MTVITATLMLSLLPAANAYIDAGSTTVLFQGIVAAIAAGGMFVKLYWRRVRSFLGPKADDDLGHPTDDAEPVETR